MKFSPALFLLAIAAICSAPSTVWAQANPYAIEQAEARRELMRAKSDFRYYWQIEYPRIQRELDALIRLTEQEIKVYKERLRVYVWSYDRFSTGSAVTMPIQDLRMCLADAELRLRDLYAERGYLIRFRTPEWRELQLRLHDARVRVAELEFAAENAANGGELPAR